MLLPLQGVTNGCALTQGVASLALGYALMPFQGASMRLCPLGAHLCAYAPSGRLGVGC